MKWLNNVDKLKMWQTAWNFWQVVRWTRTNFSLCRTYSGIHVPVCKSTNKIYLSVIKYKHLWCDLLAVHVRCHRSDVVKCLVPVAWSDTVKLIASNYYVYVFKLAVISSCLILNALLKLTGRTQFHIAYTCTGTKEMYWWYNAQPQDGIDVITDLKPYPYISALWSIWYACARDFPYFEPCRSLHTMVTSPYRVTSIWSYYKCKTLWQKQVDLGRGQHYFFGVMIMIMKFSIRCHLFHINRAFRFMIGLFILCIYVDIWEIN